MNSRIRRYLIISSLFWGLSPSLHAVQLTLEGQFLETYIDMGDSCLHKFFLKTASDQTIELRLNPGMEAGIKSGDYVVVSGTLSDSSPQSPLFVTSINKKTAPFPSLQAASVPRALITEGKMKIAVVLFNFLNNTDQTVTKAIAKDRMDNQMVPWLEAVSYGKLDVETVDVFDYLTIQENVDCSDPNMTINLHTLGPATMQANGLNVSSYNQLIYYSSAKCGSVAGLAFIGSGPSMIFGPGSFQLGVVNHELGHNFGFRHANALDCGGVALKDPISLCTTVEYGDPYDIMGRNNSAHYSVDHLKQINWISDSEVLLVTQSGDYEIGPMESAASSKKGIKIPITPGSTTNFYYLEYRQRLAKDALISDKVLNGVLLRVRDSAARTNIVDTTPSTRDWTDAAINVGSSFTTPQGIRITPLSNDPTKIRVRVEFDAQQDPGRIEFAAASYQVNEASTAATIYVGRFGAASGAVSVSYASSNGTAVSGTDYTVQSGVINFADNEAGLKPISIPITNDSVLEAMENLTVTLSNPTGGSQLGNLTSTTISIVDDDSIGTIRFSVPSLTINENVSPARINVLRENGRRGAVALVYETRDGSALSGLDYSSRGGQLNFPDQNDSPQSISIPILDDAQIEGDKQFTVNLRSAPGDANGIDLNFVVVIRDNDSLGTYSNDTASVGFQKFKNVFNPGKNEALKIKYTLSRSETLRIVNSKGEKVFEKHLEPASGLQETFWDGRVSGQSVASGVYLLMLGDEKTRAVVVK